MVTFVAAAGLLVLAGCGDDDTPNRAPAAATTAATTAATAAAAADATDADPTTVTCIDGNGGDADVAITGFTFQDRDTTIEAGGSVTFTNADPTQHSVWSAVRVDGDPAFESAGADPSARVPELLDEGDASTCSFPEPGTYEYLCGVHNNMTGTISVGPRR
jgi:plastocyanin